MLSTAKENDNVLMNNVLMNKENFCFNEIISNLNGITKISFLTTDGGPFFDDTAIAFFFGNDVFVVPSSHKCYNDIYESTSHSFVLDYKKIIEASCCVENRDFVIWKR